MNPTTKQIIGLCSSEPLKSYLLKKWEHKVGDLWVCPCDSPYCQNNIHVLSDYEVDALNKKNMEDMYAPYKQLVENTGEDFVTHWSECREGFVWLPLQFDPDSGRWQIDKIIANLIYSNSDTDVQYKFHIWLYNHSKKFDKKLFDIDSYVFLKLLWLQELVQEKNKEAK